MTTNYELSRAGFLVQDTESGHILRVTYKDGVYEGVVTMREQEMNLPLAPWKKGENPFQDDLCFSGSGGMFTAQGGWWFSIKPSVPFSRIMSEVEGLDTVGFFKRRVDQSARTTLADIVTKQTKTGYIFWDINDDLGKAADLINEQSFEVRMAYGYARRCAIDAMYLQGIVGIDVVQHVGAVFKSLQLNTGHTVDFQRKAFYDAIEFMQSYSPLITGLFAKALASVVKGYEPPGGRIADKDLFRFTMEIAHRAQEDERSNRPD